MSNEKKPGTGATNKRRKELAAAKLERQTARRTQREAVHRRRMRIGWGIAALVAVIGVAVLVLWPSGSSDDVALDDPGASASASAEPSTATASGSPSILANEYW